MTTIFLFDQKGRRPDDSFLKFSYESMELSYDIYMSFTPELQGTRVELETWFDAGGRVGVIRVSEEVRTWSWVYERRNISLDDWILWRVESIMAGLIERMWNKLIFELPNSMKPSLPLPEFFSPKDKYWGPDAHE